MSEDWISAKDAWDLVSARYSHAKDAEIAIYRYAKNGEVAARVRKLTFISNGQKIEHHNIDVPLAFWESMLASVIKEDFYGKPLFVRYKDWHLGDFSISVEKMPYELQGIRLDRLGIEKMLAASAPVADELQSAIPAQKGRPRLLDYDEIKERARVLLTEIPDLSIGSAAASIVAELPLNSKTGKPYDQRGIERKIARLWGGDK